MPTQAEIEAAAKALADVPRFFWPQLTEKERSQWRAKVMPVLEAAERVRTGEQQAAHTVAPK